HLRRASCAGYDAGDLRLGQQPGERQVEQFHAVASSERAQPFDEVVVSVGEVRFPAWVARDAGASRLWLTAAVLTGQQAAEQREVRQEGDAEALAGRQNLRLGFAPQQAVLVLDAYEA